MEYTLKEIREIELCEMKTCSGCDFLQECDGCGEKFCGVTRLYEAEWKHDKDGNAYCPDCSEILPKEYPKLFEKGEGELN